MLHRGRAVKLVIAAVAALVSVGALHAQSPAAAPTFARDVAPILYKECAGCHHAEGPGPFPLTSYEDARRHAHQIADVTRTRYMPPWLPDTKLNHFVDQLELSDTQIATLGEWAKAGAPAGDLAQAPKPPDFPAGWQLGKPDLVLTTPKPWTMAPSSTDQYRNFIFRVPLDAPRYVRAVEIRPGNTRIVHHANVLIDRNHSARSRDGKDGQPGFAGMDVEFESDTFDPESHFIYWKPGALVWSEPEGMSWELTPGTDLILNMHLQASGKTEIVNPQIGIYFTNDPPTKHPMLLTLSADEQLDIPAGAKDFKVHDDFTLPIDAEVLAIYPHAHYLGHVLDGYATLPDGKRINLIHIPQWDQGWQGIYREDKPVPLPRGTVLSMRYSYDNSADNPRNPSAKPHRVVAGNLASDEMSHLWLQLLPTPAVQQGEDARLLLQEAVMKHTLEKDPNNFSAHFNLAAAEQSSGDFAAAEVQWRAALAAKPNYAPALNGLGVALRGLGRDTEAVESFRAATASDPEYADAQFNLGEVLAQQGSIAEARDAFARAAALNPHDADAEANLGAAYAALGDMAQAKAHTARALQVDPQNKLALENFQAMQ